MSNRAPNPPTECPWEVHQLKLIAFPSEPKHAEALEWWTRVAGVESDSVVQKKLERTVTGTVDGFALTLIVDVLRAQWILSKPLTGDPEDGPALMGRYVDQLDSYCGLMERWLPGAPALKRIAFGASLMIPVTDRAEGYRKLDSYLRRVEVDPDTTDFLYRVNRRIRSQSVTNELQINRLTTWGVGAFISVQHHMNVPGAESGLTSAKTTGHACILELDINTAPCANETTLEHVTLPALFRELIALGTEIATRGDV